MQEPRMASNTVEAANNLALAPGNLDRRGLRGMFFTHRPPRIRTPNPNGLSASRNTSW